MSDVSDFTTWSSTASSNLPAGSTAIGAGLDDNLRQIQAEVAKWRDGTGYGVLTLTSVSGTNSIVGTTSPAPTLTANQKYLLVPAATNTAATVLNINSGGNKNLFWNGAALVGGELIVNVPSFVEYDGTQYNLVGGTPSVRISTLSTEQASTSGTSIDFTGIPSGAKKIYVQLIGVSTNGTSNLIVQLGDSGGIESSGYNGSVSGINSSGVGVAGASFSAGFVIANGVIAAGTYSGHVILSLEDASDFTWACSGVLARTDVATNFFYAGHKATSAALDRVRITTANGSDTFDAGAINIIYE
jgi:hypothetical protein